MKKTTLDAHSAVISYHLEKNVCIILSKGVQKGTWMLPTEMDFLAGFSVTCFHDSLDQHFLGLSTRLLIVKGMKRVTSTFGHAFCSYFPY